jgi:hypothetical protein
MIRIGFLYSLLRVEEKYLLEELERYPEDRDLVIKSGID